MPSNLEEIGVEAFSDCTVLRSVNVPTKVNLMNMDGARFYHLPALEEIVFDDGWQSIQGYTFFTITSTVKITIPKGVTSIGALTWVNNGTVTISFLGDCPQLLDADHFEGNVTISYDPDTNGWDTTPLKEAHTLIPN